MYLIRFHMVVNISPSLMISFFKKQMSQLFWNLFGTFEERVLELLGDFSGTVLELLGNFELFWNSWGTCLELLGNISRTFGEQIGNLFGIVSIRFRHLLGNSTHKSTL